MRPKNSELMNQALKRLAARRLWCFPLKFSAQRIALIVGATPKTVILWCRDFPRNPAPSSDDMIEAAWVEETGLTDKAAYLEAGAAAQQLTVDGIHRLAAAVDAFNQTYDAA